MQQNILESHFADSILYPLLIWHVNLKLFLSMWHHYLHVYTLKTN